MTDEQPLVSQAQSETTSLLPNATDILKQTWSVYKEYLSVFLGVMVIPALILTLSQITVVNDEFMESIVNASGFADAVLPLLIVIATGLVVVISQLWGQVALLYAIKDSAEKISVGEAYKRSLHKIPSYLWVSVLGGLIVVIGFTLLIIPGIIFAVWFSLAVFVLISEDLKGMSALRKSREYVRGKWWAVFGRLLFMGLIVCVISFVPTAIFNLLSLPYADELSSLVTGVFLTPLAMVYLFLLYDNIRVLR